MKFDVEKRAAKTEKFNSKDIDIARKFAKKMYQEFGSFIRILALFGSVAKEAGSGKRDIDLLVVVDDVRYKFSRELVQTYRIGTERVIADVEPERLHVQSMKLTSFWEYVRAGDPVAINILREGIALIDTGIFDPLQLLLEQGRIRPSEESVWTYFTMAPSSIHRSKQHLLTATVDLYWAVIDSAHAVLMLEGEIPPSPDHVADFIELKLVSKGKLSKKHAETVRKMYRLFKQIIHREIKEISGYDYDKYKKDAEEFVNEMKKYIERKELR